LEWRLNSIDASLVRLLKRGAQLVGKIVEYEDACRLCYIRVPEKVLVGFAEELG